ncbi:MAG: response regulator, partial [Bacteroidetes bacterium]|nr:response regulator [Bacteroidota bacterium]
MTNSKIKVLLVDDSGYMRLVLSDMLSSDPDIFVVETATDGKAAFEKTKHIKPDVVVLDLLMAKYDGLYAVKNIMKECPTPIVIVSAINTDYSEAIISALELGAFDYVKKPTSIVAPKVRSIKDELILKVKSASKVDVGNLARSKTTKKVLGTYLSNILKYRPKLVKTTKSSYSVLAIGASTGGTAAIENILFKLGNNVPVPVLIAQHLPKEFTTSFIERLNGLVQLTVRQGNKGLPLEAGNVYISPSSSNMVIKSNEGNLNNFCIDLEPVVEGQINRPSIDNLILSVAEAYGSK